MLAGFIKNTFELSLEYAAVVLSNPAGKGWRTYELPSPTFVKLVPFVTNAFTPSGAANIFLGKL